MSKKLFDIIEEKKKHFERMDKAYKDRQKAQVVLERTKDQIHREDAQEWEENREKRVNQWRNFVDKKSKTIKKQKKNENKLKEGKKIKATKFHEMKSMPIRPEQRTDVQQDKVGFTHDLGKKDDYKKTWR